MAISIKVTAANPPSSGSSNLKGVQVLKVAVSMHLSKGPINTSAVMRAQCYGGHMWHVTCVQLTWPDCSKSLGVQLWH